MRYYITAGIGTCTEPAKEVTLPIGAGTAAVLEIPGRPATERTKATLPVQVALFAPAGDKQATKVLKSITDPANRERFKDVHLLVNGFGSATNSWLLQQDKEDLTEQGKVYVDAVESICCWGPDGLAGTADLLVVISTVEMVKKGKVGRRSSVLSDACRLKRLTNREGSPINTSDGKPMRQISPLHADLFHNGQYPTPIRTWPTQPTTNTFLQMSDDQIVAIEGDIVKKTWEGKDGTQEGLEVQAKLLYALNVNQECFQPSGDEQLSKVAEAEDDDVDDLLSELNNIENNHDEVEDY